MEQHPIHKPDACLAFPRQAHLTLLLVRRGCWLQPRRWAGKPGPGSPLTCLCSSGDGWRRGAPGTGFSFTELGLGKRASGDWSLGWRPAAPAKGAAALGAESSCGRLGCAPGRVAGRPWAGPPPSPRPPRQWMTHAPLLETFVIQRIPLRPRTKISQVPFRQ